MPVAICRFIPASSAALRVIHPNVHLVLICDPSDRYMHILAFPGPTPGQPAGGHTWSHLWSLRSDLNTQVRLLPGDVSPIQPDVLTLVVLNVFVGNINIHIYILYHLWTLRLCRLFTNIRVEDNGLFFVHSQFCPLMSSDALATQGSMPSTAIVLTVLSQNI